MMACLLPMAVLFLLAGVAQPAPSPQRERGDRLPINPLGSLLSQIRGIQEARGQVVQALLLPVSRIARPTQTRNPSPNLSKPNGAVDDELGVPEEKPVEERPKHGHRRRPSHRRPSKPKNRDRNEGQQADDTLDETEDDPDKNQEPEVARPNKKKNNRPNSAKEKPEKKTTPKEEPMKIEDTTRTLEPSPSTPASQLSVFSGFPQPPSNPPPSPSNPSSPQGNSQPSLGNLSPPSNPPPTPLSPPSNPPFTPLSPPSNPPPTPGNLSPPSNPPPTPLSPPSNPPPFQGILAPPSNPPPAWDSNSSPFIPPAPAAPRLAPRTGDNEEIDSLTRTIINAACRNGGAHDGSCREAVD